MKKAFLIFSLFIFHFSFGQNLDTLVYKTGKKMAVKKIMSIWRTKVIYKLPDDIESVNKSELDYIKYRDGSIYSIQQEEKNNPDSLRSREQSVTINAGAGLSFMLLAVPGTGYGLFGGGFSLISYPPAFNLTAEYRLFRHISFGGGVAYQWFTDNPQFYENQYASWETERITRTNIAGTLLYHFSKKGKNDFYAGVRVGASFWTDQVSYNSPPQIPGSYYPIIASMRSPSVQRASFQALFGYRRFFSDTGVFGFHFEYGFGTPYIIEGGLTFRFKTKK
jgi:hypothetical protein